MSNTTITAIITQCGFSFVNNTRKDATFSVALKENLASDGTSDILVEVTKHGLSGDVDTSQGVTGFVDSLNVPALENGREFSSRGVMEGGDISESGLEDEGMEGDIYV